MADTSKLTGSTLGGPGSGVTPPRGDGTDTGSGNGGIGILDTNKPVDKDYTPINIISNTSRLVGSALFPNDNNSRPQSQQDIIKHPSQTTAYVNDLYMDDSLLYPMQTRKYNKQSVINIDITKLKKEATIPEYANDGDATMKLSAISYDYDNELDCYIYHTGLAISIPKGFVLLISPLYSNKSTEFYMPNGVGIFNHGYKGEIIVCFKCRESSTTVSTINNLIIHLRKWIVKINAIIKEINKIYKIIKELRKELDKIYDILEEHLYNFEKLKKKIEEEIEKIKVLLEELQTYIDEEITNLRTYIDGEVTRLEADIKSTNDLAAYAFIRVVNLQTSVDSINSEISDLWTAINNIPECECSKESATLLSAQSDYSELDAKYAKRISPQTLSIDDLPEKDPNTNPDLGNGGDDTDDNEGTDEGGGNPGNTGGSGSGGSTGGDSTGGDSGGNTGGNTGGGNTGGSTGGDSSDNTGGDNTGEDNGDNTEEEKNPFVGKYHPTERIELPKEELEELDEESFNAIEIIEKFYTPPYEVGVNIAQMMIMPFPKVFFTEVSSIGTTEAKYEEDEDNYKEEKE